MNRAQTPFSSLQNTHSDHIPLEVQYEIHIENKPLEAHFEVHIAQNLLKIQHEAHTEHILHAVLYRTCNETKPPEGT